MILISFIETILKLKSTHHALVLADGLKGQNTLEFIASISFVKIPKLH